VEAEAQPPEQPIVDGPFEQTPEKPQAEMPELPAAPAEADVTLTEVASDHELFEDPNLDVAAVAPGEEREIVIPVELSGEGVSARRFKLTVRLRLDAVE
jgi:hypothetical protein